MILKVVVTKSVAGSGKISYINVIYESGRRIKYKPDKVPGSVERFIKEHVEHVNSIGNTWIQKTYVYNELRKGVNNM